MDEEVGEITRKRKQNQYIAIKKKDGTTTMELNEVKGRTENQEEQNDKGAR